MKYCKECILPDTRPGLVIDTNGVCNACKNSKEKSVLIDWVAREKDFRRIVELAKSRSKGYDCVIPVSGGKDSTWQVVKCLEYGLNPLAVTWKTPGRTAIGTYNLNNLIKLGIDHIDYQINPKVEKKFMYKAFVKHGSTGIPMHMAIFNIPLKIALKFEIPLVVWGENSALEYGTDEEVLKDSNLDSKWLKKFGVMNGTTAKDWISKDLTEKELAPYFGPSDKELSQKKIKAIFLGNYFNWDVKKSLMIALKNGFKIRKEGPKVGYYNYADIDDDFISIHHYLKWYKFGFTRLFDNLSIEIRNGRLTREKALKILKEKGTQVPCDDINKFCRLVDITVKDFYKIIEKFRNRNIWRKVNGKWIIKDFIIKDWKW